MLIMKNSKLPEFIRRDLSLFKSLNIQSVNDALNGCSVLNGFALEHVKKRCKSVDNGLKAWGDGFKQEKQRQEKRLAEYKKVINEALQ